MPFLFIIILLLSPISVLGQQFKEFQMPNSKWRGVATDNFYIFYDGNNRDLALRVAIQVEDLRNNCLESFGCAKRNLNKKARIILYSSDNEYKRLVPHKDAPSVTHITPGRESIVRVNIFHPRHSNGLETVESSVAYEINHVVFAQLCPTGGPDWASEGCAMLSDSSHKDRWERKLVKDASQNKFWHFEQFMNSEHIPQYDSDKAHTYFAQAYGLADFLTGPNGLGTKAQFMQFINDAQIIGYEESLQKNYGIRNYEELQSMFNQYIEKKIALKNEEKINGQSQWRPAAPIKTQPTITPMPYIVPTPNP